MISVCFLAGCDLFFPKKEGTITFESNGGTPVAQQEIIGYVIEPTPPTKVGHTFDGWYADADLTNPWAFEEDEIAGDMTLYAKWLINTFQITYDANRATGGEVPSVQTKIFGTGLILVGNTGSLVRSGYSFNGWNTSIDGSGNDYAAGDTYAIEASDILYVKWLADTYTISYSATQATGGEVPSPQTKTYAENLIIVGNTGLLIKDGYTFIGWNTEDDSSGTFYAAGASYALEGDEILYAQWGENHTVTYNGNEETSGTVPGDQTKTYGEELTLESNTGDLKKTGYTFECWNSFDDGSGTSYEEGATYTEEEDIELYALWTADLDTPYTVEHYKQNAHDSTDYTLAETEDRIGPTDETATAEAKSYTGFIENENHTSRIVSGTISAGNALVLKLYYDIITYSISYDDNGADGGIVPSDQTKVYGETLSLSSNSGSLVKSGYIFGGWNTSIDGTLTDYAEGSEYTANREMILYAKWNLDVEKLLAADGVSTDLFGYAVSIDGDTAVISALEDDEDAGSVYIFVESGGNWTQEAKLVASDRAAEDLFGHSVSISGDTVLIGARDDDDKGSQSGSAYVFFRSGTTWTQQEKLTASDGGIEDLFGYSVSIDGNTAVVGACFDDTEAIDAGSVYVFTRSGIVWTEEARLTAGDGTISDRFGNAVCIDGDTVLIGAYGDDVGQDFGVGSAYIFTRSGSEWSQQAKLTIDDGIIDDYFGSSVCLEGDTAVIGAQLEDDNGLDSGSAYIFGRSGGIWSQEKKLIASDGEAGDNYGHSVSIAGNRVVVGSSGDDMPDTNAGCAYSYEYDPITEIWGEEQRLQARDVQAGDLFGVSVSISGNTVLFGAPHDDDNGFRSGSAYVWDIPPGL